MFVLNHLRVVRSGDAQPRQAVVPQRPAVALALDDVQDARLVRLVEPLRAVSTDRDALGLERLILAGQREACALEEEIAGRIADRDEDALCSVVQAQFPQERDGESFRLRQHRDGDGPAVGLATRRRTAHNILVF
jgi:hypothetical protein